MIPVLSREQMRALDRYAIQQARVPGAVLMENAGRGACDAVTPNLPERARVCVVCGPGNNGGDGFVVARRLKTLGHRVTLFLVADPGALTGDAKLNHDAWVGLGESVLRVTALQLPELAQALAASDLVIDALLGTGLDRAVSEIFADIIGRLNKVQVPVISLDVPSGLDANTGEVLGVAVRATKTVTFAHPKLGLMTPMGCAYSGELVTVDIGVPREFVEKVGVSAWQLEASDVARLIAPRPSYLHKAAAGRVLVVAGSPGTTGAALLVGRGALRAGAGLVRLCADPPTVESLEQRVLELMTARIVPRDVAGSLGPLLEEADTVVIGPGLGHGEIAKAAIEYVVLEHSGVIVVDADAISHFAGRGADLAKAKGSLIFTPHPGELGRLLGSSSHEVERDRFVALRRAVELTGATVVLKGSHTLVGAPSEIPVVHPKAVPALATAGSGDVLAGIIGALAVGLTPFQAAYAGVYLHARSAEMWGARTGSDRGLLAREIADGLPLVFAELAAADSGVTD